MMKITEMYRRSTGTRGDKRCSECSNFLILTDGKSRQFRCMLYPIKEGHQADWSKKYPACAWFDKEPPKTSAVESQKKKREEFNGQMSLSDFSPNAVKG